MAHAKLVDRKTQDHPAYASMCKDVPSGADGHWHCDCMRVEVSRTCLPRPAMGTMLDHNCGKGFLLVGCKCCAPRGRVELMLLFKIKFTRLLNLYPQLSGRVPASVASSICSPLRSVMFAQLSLKVPVTQVSSFCWFDAQLTTSSHESALCRCRPWWSGASAQRHLRG